MDAGDRTDRDYETYIPIAFIIPVCPMTPIYSLVPSAKKRFTSGGRNPRPDGLRPPYASRAP